jgi:hypothetical protein
MGGRRHVVEPPDDGASREGGPPRRVGPRRRGQGGRLAQRLERPLTSAPPLQRHMDPARRSEPFELAVDASMDL